MVWIQELSPLNDLFDMYPAHSIICKINQMQLTESDVLADPDKTQQKYFVIFSLCDKTQNMADNGQFLEI